MVFALSPDGVGGCPLGFLVCSLNVRLRRKFGNDARGEVLGTIDATLWPISLDLPPNIRASPDSSCTSLIFDSNVLSSAVKIN